MALIFPANPSINQIYQSGSSATYRYNGLLWEAVLPDTRTTQYAVSASYAVTASYAPVSLTASYAATASYAINGGSGGNDWISAGTASFNAITIPLTKSTSKIYDFTKYRAVSPTAYEVWYQYAHNSSTGVAAGNGVYMFTLPAGLEFGSSVQKINSYIVNTNTPYLIPVVGHYCVNNTFFTHLSAMPFSNTQFYIVGGKSTINEPQSFNNTNSGFTLANLSWAVKIIVETA